MRERSGVGVNALMKGTNCMKLNCDFINDPHISIPDIEL